MSKNDIRPEELGFVNALRQLKPQTRELVISFVFTELRTHDTQDWIKRSPKKTAYQQELALNGSE